MQASTALDIATIDLVIANKVLARVGAVDAYGHVSVRHPTDPARFLLSRSRSPELVERDDIMVLNLDGTVHGTDNRPPYLERFIHAAVYEARPGRACGGARASTRTVAVHGREPRDAAAVSHSR